MKKILYLILVALFACHGLKCSEESKQMQSRFKTLKTLSSARINITDKELDQIKQQIQITDKELDKIKQQIKIDSEKETDTHTLCFNNIMWRIDHNNTKQPVSVISFEKKRRSSEEAEPEKNDLPFDLNNKNKEIYRGLMAILIKREISKSPKNREFTALAGFAKKNGLDGLNGICQDLSVPTITAEKCEQVRRSLDEGYINLLKKNFLKPEATQERPATRRRASTHSLATSRDSIEELREDETDH